MIRPGQSVTGGEPIRGIQAEADDGNARLAEQRQQTTADPHGILNRMLTVASLPPEALQRRAAHDDRRVDTHKIGSEPNQLACGPEGAFVIVAGKAGHHLQAKGKARFPNAMCRPANIPGCMTAAGHAQNLVLHGLGTEFDRRNAIVPETVQGFRIYGIGPGRQTHGSNQPCIQSLLCLLKIDELLLRRDGRKAAAVKSKLPTLSGAVLFSCRAVFAPGVEARAARSA